MIVAQPAAAELRIIKSGLTKPFPAIGDAVVGCRNPADTVHWIDIITGKTWEREIVQDGQRQTLHPSLRDVAIGVRGFFHSYISTGDCWGYDDGDNPCAHAQNATMPIQSRDDGPPRPRLSLCPVGFFGLLSLAAVSPCLLLPPILQGGGTSTVAPYGACP
jgi:hypothetical protein